jgi:hypothetical protein
MGEGDTKKTPTHKPSYMRERAKIRHKLDEVMGDQFFLVWYGSLERKRNTPPRGWTATDADPLDADEIRFDSLSGDDLATVRNGDGMLAMLKERLTRLNATGGNRTKYRALEIKTLEKEIESAEVELGKCGRGQANALPPNSNIAPTFTSTTTGREAT